MAPPKDIVNDSAEPDSAEPDKIDRNAPAGSEHSLGAQSVRDGRPVTDDSVVEAMDEEGPGIDSFYSRQKRRRQPLDAALIPKAGIPSQTWPCRRWTCSG